jgi:hypothetical protein
MKGYSLRSYYDINPLIMSRRGRSTKRCNDSDLVQPTVYRPSSLTSLPSQYSHIGPHPAFKPLVMDPVINPGPILPSGLNSEDPEAVFRLLFDDRILNRIVRCTNRYAASKQHKKSWKPVSNEDILSYLGIVIFFGLEDTPEQRNYWNTSLNGSIYP